MSESSEFTAVSTLEAVLKERYIAEHDRRDKANSLLQLPTTITSALIGVVYYYAIHMQDLLLSFWTVVFYSLLGLLVVSLIASMVLMLFAYHDRDAYAYLPDPKEIAANFAAWEEYAKDPSGVVDWKTTEVNFKRMLGREYAKTAQINADYNDRKAWNFFHARGALIISLLFTLLSVGPYSLSPKKPPPDPPIKVKLVMSPAPGVGEGRLASTGRGGASTSHFSAE